MKKLTIIALVLFGAFTVKAQDDQEFKPFKVDISVGYAIPGGSVSKGGILFVVEPKYAVVNNIAVGLRMEGAVVARVGSFVNGEPQAADVKAAASYLATGDYYFTNNYSFRPFAGAGMGIFNLAGATAHTDGSGAVAGGSKFGGMVRAGIETGHFRFGLEYNLMSSTDGYGTDANGNATTQKIKNGYLGIKIGAVIGGGPKR